MQDPQKVFSELQEKRKQLKELKRQFREELEAIPEYVELAEKKKSLNERIKQIKTSVEQSNPELANKIDDLKIDIASDKEMLSDILLNKYVAGEQVELKDEFNNNFQMAFSFTLKKE